MTKYPQKECGGGPQAKFVNFGTPFVNLELVQLETQNLVGLYWITGIVVYIGMSHLMGDKYPQNGCGGVHRPNLSILRLIAIAMNEGKI